MPKGTRDVRWPWLSAGWQQQAMSLLCLAAAYMGVDLLFTRFATGAGWTILWPINGVTIALLLRTPRKRWPLLLLAIEAGLLLAQLVDGYPLGQELLKRACSTMEVVGAAWMLPVFVSMEDWLGQPQMVRRVSLALVLPPGVTAVFYALQMHMHAGTPLLTGWNWWGPPDMLGNALVLPVALACFAPETRALMARGRRGRTLLTLALSALVSGLIFSEGSYPLLFLLYPLLLYVDSQLSFTGSSIAILLSSVMGLFCTVHGFGPFGRWAPGLQIPSGTALQMYLGFHTLALLPLSLVILERKEIAEQLRRANAQLVALAQQDSLTGIGNRRAFEEGFAEAWNHACESGTPLAVLMIDIDHFKQFNDLYGHLLGDRCLARVAAVLARVVVTAGALVARFGGEEFAVLLPDVSESECCRIAELLRQAVASAGIAHDGNPWGLVTISVGIASGMAARQGDRLELLGHADAALYRAKQRGRNRVEGAGGEFQEARMLRPSSMEVRTAVGV